MRADVKDDSSSELERPVRRTSKREAHDDDASTDSTERSSHHAANGRGNRLAGSRSTTYGSEGDYSCPPTQPEARARDDPPSEHTPNVDRKGTSWDRYQKRSSPSQPSPAGETTDTSFHPTPRRALHQYSEESYSRSPEEYVDGDKDGAHDESTPERDTSSNVSGTPTEPSPGQRRHRDGYQPTGKRAYIREPHTQLGFAELPPRPEPRRIAEEESPSRSRTDTQRTEEDASIEETRTVTASRAQSEHTMECTIEQSPSLLTPGKVLSHLRREEEETQRNGRNAGCFNVLPRLSRSSAVSQARAQHNTGFRNAEDDAFSDPNPSDSHGDVPPHRTPRRWLEREIDALPSASPESVHKPRHTHSATRRSPAALTRTDDADGSVEQSVGRDHPSEYTPSRGHPHTQSPRVTGSSTYLSENPSTGGGFLPSGDGTKDSICTPGDGSDPHPQRNPRRSLRRDIEESHSETPQPQVNSGASSPWCGEETTYTHSDTATPATRTTRSSSRTRQAATLEHAHASPSTGAEYPSASFENTPTRRPVSEGRDTEGETVKVRGRKLRVRRREPSSDGTMTLGGVAIETHLVTSPADVPSALSSEPTDGKQYRRKKVIVLKNVIVVPRSSRSNEAAGRSTPPAATSPPVASPLPRSNVAETGGGVVGLSADERRCVVRRRESPSPQKPAEGPTVEQVCEMYEKDINDMHAEFRDIASSTAAFVKCLQSVDSEVNDGVEQDRQQIRQRRIRQLERLLANANKKSMGLFESLQETRGVARHATLQKKLADGIYRNLQLCAKQCARAEAGRSEASAANARLAKEAGDLRAANEALLRDNRELTEKVAALLHAARKKEHRQADPPASAKLTHGRPRILRRSPEVADARWHRHPQRLDSGKDGRMRVQARSAPPSAFDNPRGSPAGRQQDVPDHPPRGRSPPAAKPAWGISTGANAAVPVVAKVFNRRLVSTGRSRTEQPQKKGSASMTAATNAPLVFADEKRPETVVAQGMKPGPKLTPNAGKSARRPAAAWVAGDGIDEGEAEALARTVPVQPAAGRAGRNGGRVVRKQQLSPGASPPLTPGAGSGPGPGVFAAAAFPSDYIGGHVISDDDEDPMVLYRRRKHMASRDPPGRTGTQT
ncbi:hypothetical protein DIPPA_31757 [Diplonema papillatum]|nr:hypothetical protein DIPPA_31757 [Diplonema papillatum]